MRPYKIVIRIDGGVPSLVCADGPVEILVLEHDIDYHDEVTDLEDDGVLVAPYGLTVCAPSNKEIEETWRLFGLAEKFWETLAVDGPA